MSEQEHDSELNQEFLQACEDTENFDFGFTEQRRDDNFANFGTDPEEAEKLQHQEMDRFAATAEDEGDIDAGIDWAWDDEDDYDDDHE